MNTPRLLVVLSLVSLGACGGIRRGEFVTPFMMPDPQWHQLYADSLFVTSIDAAHVSPGPEKDTVEVWYENRHQVRRDDQGRAWNREVIHSLLRCEPLSFKTVLTTIFLDNGPALAQLGGNVESVRDKPWKAVVPNTPDAGTLGGACSFLREGGHVL